jgi:hypothetical protein
MARSGWSPLDNPYKAYVRVAGGAVHLHEEMLQMLREMGGPGTVPADPAALLTLLDAAIARLEGPDGERDPAVAHVHRYELRMLRAAVWEALEAQSPYAAPGTPPGIAAAGGRH